MAQTPDVAARLSRMQARPSYHASPMKPSFEMFANLPQPTDVVWPD